MIWTTIARGDNRKTLLMKICRLCSHPAVGWKELDTAVNSIRRRLPHDRHRWPVTWLEEACSLPREAGDLGTFDAYAGSSYAVRAALEKE